MYLKELALINFKNYREVKLVFSPGINCFVGHNGAGKTNLLDAIHYLSFCKSYFNAFDNQNIFYEEDMFIIQGLFDKDGQAEDIYCAQKRNERKQFKRNKKDYERLSEHIGLLPVVMVSPTDTELVLGGGEVRRKFVDSILSQADAQYLKSLIEYNKALLQRNAMLKKFYETRSWDEALMSIWDEIMIEKGTEILKKREAFTQEFSDIFQSVYAEISGERERAELQYSSQLQEADLASLLIKNLAKDKTVLYSSVGIHKDDWLFFNNGHSLKKFASQGLQKSYIIALKLAQFFFLKKYYNSPPIMLLDDIFDKLDEERVKYLINIVTGNNFGQVFVTDTNPARMRSLLQKQDKEHQIFPISSGLLQKVRPDFV